MTVRFLSSITSCPLRKLGSVFPNIWKSVFRRNFCHLPRSTSNSSCYWVHLVIKFWTFYTIHKLWYILIYKSYTFKYIPLTVYLLFFICFYTHTLIYRNKLVTVYGQLFFFLLIFIFLAWLCLWDLPGFEPFPVVILYLNYFFYEI